MQFITAKEQQFLDAIQQLKDDAKSRQQYLQESLDTLVSDFDYYTKECGRYRSIGSVCIDTLQDVCVHLANAAYCLPDFSYVQLRRFVQQYAMENDVKLESMDTAELFTFIAQLVPVQGVKLAPVVSVVVRVMLSADNWFNSQRAAYTKSLDRLQPDLDADIAKVTRDMELYKASVAYQLDVKDAEITYLRSLVQA